MTDDLHPILNATEGGGPSSEFVTELRTRLLHEIAEVTDANGPLSVVTSSAVPLGADDDLLDIDLTPTPKDAFMTPKRLTALAAAAVLLFLVGLGINAILGGDDNLIEINDPATDTTSDPDGTEIGTPPEFQADAPLLVRDFAILPVGVNRVDTAGTPFSFETSRVLGTAVNAASRFVLSEQSSTGPGDRDIVFMRVSELWNPDTLSEPFAAIGDGWSADDFEGWVDALPEGVERTSVESTMIGGLPAQRVELQIGSNACRASGAICIGFGTSHLAATKVLNVGERYRIWVVEQEEEDPLAIIVGIRSQLDERWFDTANEILASLAFGPVAPNPVRSTPPGPLESTLLGGTRFDVLVETALVQPFENYGWIPFGSREADTEFFTNPVDVDGNPVATTDELVALIEPSLSELTELDPVTVGGIDARVFSIRMANSPQPTLLRDVDDTRGWPVPPQGRLWMIDHPERGLLMINAEASDLDTGAFDAVVAETERLLQTLEFIDVN